MQESLRDDDEAVERVGHVPSLANGVALISRQLPNLPANPGVYRFNDAKGDPLYIGKAKNLRRRVAAYTRPQRLPSRICRAIAATDALEIISTHTEVEALLLESNLIKRLRPRYNIVLRDDKSFPFILLTRDHAAPQLLKHRGAQNRKGDYFGPFASAGAVNRTLSALQKVFPLRNCSDSVYASRTRPCLQYQIKRCAAPCVDRISLEDYKEIVAQAHAFLTGRSQTLRQELTQRMERAADALDYETAAIYRDRIRALSQIEAHQDINVSGIDEADVIAIVKKGGQSCVQVFFFRAGQNFGNRTYFPNHEGRLPESVVLEAFLAQFYSDKIPPKLVLVSHEPTSMELLSQALDERAERRVELTQPVRGTKRKLVTNALENAREALERRLSESATQRRLLEQTADAFGIDGTLRRIEVFDNSHIAGQNALGAMIVAGPDGLMKNAYRKFNIKNEELTPGDDYAMMREVLGRRFARAIKEDPDRTGDTWPDLVLVDGGPGQLSVANEVLADLGVSDLPLVCIAKGIERNAGREKFYMADRQPFSLPPNHPVLYFTQRLRDEAHRFAIGSHRARRSKAIGRSVLDEIPGIGRQRKRALLHHFGSAAGVERAGLEDLEVVEGISKTVAKKIYDHFHAGG